MTFFLLQSFLQNLSYITTFRFVRKSGMRQNEYWFYPEKPAKKSY